MGLLRVEYQMGSVLTWRLSGALVALVAQRMWRPDSSGPRLVDNDDSCGAKGGELL